MTPWQAYKLRWKRRRLLWRAFRSRNALQPLGIPDIPAKGILAFICMRNEMGRLPYMLDHYRALGVTHFLIVDNGSTDGSIDFCRDQPDTSVWRCDMSYRDARFGLDWTNWLLLRFGHDRWCLTVDADELLVYANHETRNLSDLTSWLDQRGHRAFGALMLDLYPKGPLGQGPMLADPLKQLTHFDDGPYRNTRQSRMQNLWTQGGVRERVFFPDAPKKSPTLNKIPLVRWSRRYVYVNSTHSALPYRLNLEYDGPGGVKPSGVLLHTKFLPEVLDKTAEDQDRRQHFHNPNAYREYYTALRNAPTLWHSGSKQYEGWEQLVDLGLMQSGGFPD
jgi:hypothetical protein